MILSRSNAKTGEAWPLPIFACSQPILVETRSVRDLIRGSYQNYICSEAVRPPACLDFDVEAHALVMEDVSDLPDLGEALRRG